MNCKCKIRHTVFSDRVCDTHSYPAECKEYCVVGLLERIAELEKPNQVLVRVRYAHDTGEIEAGVWADRPGEAIVSVSDALHEMNESYVPVAFGPNGNPIHQLNCMKEDGAS